MLTIYDPTPKSGTDNVRKAIETGSARHDRTFARPSTTNQVFFLLESVGLLSHRQTDGTHDPSADVRSF